MFERPHPDRDTDLAYCRAAPQGGVLRSPDMIGGVLASLLILSAPSLFAQATASRVLGAVQDAAGAAVPAAKVQLINEGTRTTFETRTSESGAFVFEAVQPGVFTVSVEAAGFKKLMSTASEVSIGQPATLNVRLEVGGLTQQVEVTATAELVQTSTPGNFGNLITGREIRDMPIVGTRGRNPVNPVFWQPGVVSGAGTGGSSHVHGARDRAWNYTLDGVDVNESSAGGSELTLAPTRREAKPPLFRASCAQLPANSPSSLDAGLAERLAGPLAALPVARPARQQVCRPRGHCRFWLFSRSRRGDRGH